MSFFLTAIVVAGMVIHWRGFQIWKGCKGCDISPWPRLSEANTHQCEAVNDRGDPQMDRVAEEVVNSDPDNRRSASIGTHEKGTGVVRIRSSPVKLSTSRVKLEWKLAGEK
jgi:hypothetical protein